MNFTKRYLKKLIRIIKKPEMKVLPGNIAFFLVLSIFPIITLCGFLATFFNVSIDSVIGFMNTALPNEVNNYFRRRIKALFITILLVTLFVFTLLVLAFGNYILKFILSFNFFGNLSNSFYYLFLLLKWPFAIIFIFFMIKLIFTIAPDSLIKSKITTRGAFFTSISWIVSTFIYSYYVMHFSNYDIFYGSLSNIIVMMMWIYILSCSLVIGIAISVQDYNEYIRNNNLESVNNS